MSLKIVWSAVCVHCRARIGGQARYPINLPASFRQSCPSCGEPLVITLVEEGAIVTVGPRSPKEEHNKPR